MATLMGFNKQCNVIDFASNGQLYRGRAVSFLVVNACSVSLVQLLPQEFQKTASINLELLRFKTNKRT
ncbi:hypothetical protein [Peribacillus simplex]|uniref:hypothetical protein n=1 Tax=Peribacillus simplex TaxID=1478 RepID=UPI0012D9B819|nr:hypothetical protein [Peribacillus simplex]